MSTAENKLYLIKLITESQDNSFISRLLEFVEGLKATKETNWADDLPTEVIEALHQSINESDEEVSHEMMVREAREKYSDLDI